MSTIKLNLTKPGNATAQDETAAGAFPSGGWYANLLNLDGTPFKKAGKEYVGIPIHHGYAEIKDVPEGHYLLYAMENPFQVGSSGGGVIWQANFVSHFAIVEICCGCKDVCVTLYNSGWHYCYQIIIWWFELLAMHQQMNKEVAQKAADALYEAAKSTGELQPGDKTILKTIEAMKKQFARQADKK